MSIWRKVEIPPGGSGISAYEKDGIQVRKFDDTARGKYNWAVFKDNEAVTRNGRMVCASTLRDAKLKAERVKEQ